jgi:hypothetical protein
LIRLNNNCHLSSPRSSQTRNHSRYGRSRILRLATFQGSLHPYFLTSLPHQFDKHLIRNTQLLRSQSYEIPFAFHEPRQRQRIKSIRQRYAIFTFDSAHIDSIQLPQPEKQFLFESALRRQLLMLLHRQSPAPHRRDISGRIVRVRPSVCPRKRMCPRPKSQVRLAPPIFQIVL